MKIKLLLITALLWSFSLMAQTQKFPLPDSFTEITTTQKIDSVTEAVIRQSVIDYFKAHPELREKLSQATYEYTKEAIPYRRSRRETEEERKEREKELEQMERDRQKTERQEATFLCKIYPKGSKNGRTMQMNCESDSSDF